MYMFSQLETNSEKVQAKACAFSFVLYYLDMDKLIWTARVREVVELKDLEKNPRKINKDSFERLCKRIEDRGFHDVIKLDTNDVILSGNQRRKALNKLGVTSVNTLYPNRELTEEERKKIIVESNRNDGFFDDEMLAGMFDIDELKDLGFDEKELGLGDFDDMDSLTKENATSGLAIKINFKNKEDLDNCLIEVNELLKRYNGSSVVVNGSQ